MRLASASILTCLAFSAAAQTPPKLEPLPEAPPPPVIEQDSDSEPQVTILRRGEDTVEEFRVRGQLYMVKVTPPHGRPYYLVDRKGDGNMVRTDSLEPGIVVPLWVIKSW